jgi:hypothetical protein
MTEQAVIHFVKARKINMDSMPGRILCQEEYKTISQKKYREEVLKLSACGGI